MNPGKPVFGGHFFEALWRAVEEPQRLPVLPESGLGTRDLSVCPRCTYKRRPVSIPHSPGVGGVRFFFQLLKARRPKWINCRPTAVRDVDSVKSLSNKRLGLGWRGITNPNSLPTRVESTRVEAFFAEFIVHLLTTFSSSVGEL